MGLGRGSVSPTNPVVYFVHPPRCSPANLLQFDQVSLVITSQFIFFILPTQVKLFLVSSELLMRSKEFLLIAILEHISTRSSEISHQSLSSYFRILRLTTAKNNANYCLFCLNRRTFTSVRRHLSHRTRHLKRREAFNHRLPAPHKKKLLSTKYLQFL